MATERQKAPNPGPDGPFGRPGRDPRGRRARANAHGPAPRGDPPGKPYRTACGRRPGGTGPDAVHLDGAGRPSRVEGA